MVAPLALFALGALGAGAMEYGNRKSAKAAEEDRAKALQRAMQYSGILGQDRPPGIMGGAARPGPTMNAWQGLPRTQQENAVIRNLIQGGYQDKAVGMIEDRMKPQTRKAPIEVNGQLIDPYTYKVIADFRTPQAPKERRIVKGADGRNYYEDDKSLVLPGVKEQGQSSNDIFTQEKDLRSAYTTESKPYRDIADSYARMESLFFNPSETIQNIDFGDAKITDAQGAADIALLVSFMKMVDPGSVVREGEFATAENAGGVDNKIRNSYNRLLEGARLDDEQRQSFLQQARRLYEGQAGRQKKVNERFGELAGSYDLNADRVVAPLYEPRISFGQNVRPQAGPGVQGAQASQARPATRDDAGEILREFPNARFDDNGAFIYKGGQKMYIMVEPD